MSSSTENSIRARSATQGDGVQTAAVPADRLLLTVDGVAYALAVSPRTVWRLVSTGHLPGPIRLPGIKGTRWLRTDVERFVASIAADQRGDGPVSQDQQAGDRDGAEGQGG